MGGIKLICDLANLRLHNLMQICELASKLYTPIVWWWPVNRAEKHKRCYAWWLHFKYYWKIFCPFQEFFVVFLCTLFLYFIRTCSFILIVTHFGFLLSVLTGKHKHPCLRWIFLFCFRFVLFPYFFVLTALALPFVLTAQHTQTQTSIPRRDWNLKPQQTIGRRPLP